MINDQHKTMGVSKHATKSFYVLVREHQIFLIINNLKAQVLKVSTDTSKMQNYSVD
jgi:hypothetical protein